MKGIIFNFLEDFVIMRLGLGDERWDELCKEAHLQTQGPFVGPGTYPDADLLALVARTCEVTQIPSSVAMRAFGSYCFGELAKRFPNFVIPYKHPKDFLLTVDSIIHIEVKKLFKDAETPRFTYHDKVKNRLTIDYFSQRKLCHLMEGLLDGTEKYFGIAIDQTQTRCLLKGDPVCQFDLCFS